jgi:hypothetical protein
VTAGANRKKKGKMSERSELFSLPDLCLTAPGTLEEGYDPAAAFFCLLFLAEQEK